MTHPYWPLADLRVHVQGIALRPLTEGDIMQLARMLPDDVEVNPDSTHFEGADQALSRGTIVHQDYWRAMGTWTVDSWRLNFGVWQSDRLVGAQELEAHQFALLRTVDTASFLVSEKRGTGLGKAMRRGVLALAFDHLGAEYAVTSAWHDNAASLGVSRALGYADNGWSRHPRGEGADEMAHLRMARADWLAAGHGDGVAVTGVEPCLPYFGITAT